VPAPDPMDLIIANAREEADSVIAYWTAHLENLTSAYAKYKDRIPRDNLIYNTVKTLMESDNDREALCYQVMIAVDMMARMR